MSDLRIVKGNDFATLYTIRAMYADGTIVEDFDLRVCTDVQVIVHRTYSKSVASLLSANEYGSYSLEPENVLRINWDGLLVKLGTYTVDFRAKFRGADIRSYSIKDLIFDIVETNEEANIPAGAFVDNGVYVFSGDFVLMFESQVQADWDEADTDSPAYIKNKPTIPDEVTEQTVADWGFTKNTGDYTKPEGGIPLSDLDAGVQSSLEKADTAYQLPSGGVPYDELSQSVQESLDKADTAYQKPPTGIPASDIASGVIPDVSQFITRSVDDLVNYYLKSETYTKTEVQGLIAAINQFHYEIYPSTSAVTNPQGNVLYLIGPTGTGADKYDEYVYTNNTWVKIGDTSIDLSGYVTTQALNSALASYSTTSQMNNAIAAALANYTTTANLNTLLAGKQDVLTFDNVPTDGSSNPVKSGGVYNVINSLKSAGYVFAGVATTSTSPGTPTEKVFYIGGAGTYANFGSSYTVPVGSIGVFKYNGSWAKEQIALFAGIDDVPMTGSDNLVKSGGVSANSKIVYTISSSDASGRASFYSLNLLNGTKYRILLDSDMVFSTSSTNAIIVRDGGIQGTINTRTTDKTITYFDFTSHGETTISVYVNANGIPVKIGLVEIIDTGLQAEIERATNAENEIMADVNSLSENVEPIIDAVNDLNWTDGSSEYTFNGTTSKAVLTQPIVLSQNGDSIEFIAAPASADLTESYAFMHGSSSSGIGIGAGQVQVYVRADDNTWIFQQITTVSRSHTYKLSYESGNIVLYKDGDVLNTYTGQKTITLTVFGDRGESRPLWGGTLVSLKINNVSTQLKKIATLTDVSETIITPADHSFLSLSEKEILYSGAGNMKQMYAQKTSTELDIFIKLNDNEYLKYPLQYRYKAYQSGVSPSFYDNWGIGKVAVCIFDGNTMVQTAELFYSSEAELTIALGGITGNNIVGGGMHGFDNIVVGTNGREICFIIDNQKIGETDTFNLKPVTKIQVQQVSQVNTPETDTGVFGKVSKEWLWEDGKLIIDGRFTATTSVEIEHIYSSLLGCYRHWNGVVTNNYLTNKAIKNDYPFKVYDISDNASLGDLGIKDKSCTKITAYGEMNIGISMEILETNGLQNGGMFISTNNNPYNKIYNMICGVNSMSSGDSLYAKTCWEIYY